MTKLNIAAMVLCMTASGAVVGAWGQQTVQRRVAPAPRVNEAPAASTLQPEPAVPVMSGHELGHVLQQTHPPSGLTRDETRSLQRVSERLRHKDRVMAKELWEGVVRSVARRNAPVNVDDMVAYVLRASYIESSRELKDYADKVRLYNEQKKAAREHEKELRRQKAELERSDDPTRTVTVRRLTLSDNYDDRGRVVRVAPPADMTVDSVAKELQRIVVLCNTAEDNEQMARMDLQNALQKQQQTMQTMSNVSKMLHDAAKNVVNNIR